MQSYLELEILCNFVEVCKRDALTGVWAELAGRKLFVLRGSVSCVLLCCSEEHRGVFCVVRNSLSGLSSRDLVAIKTIKAIKTCK